MANLVEQKSYELIRLINIKEVDKSPKVISQAHPFEKYVGMGVKNLLTIEGDQIVDGGKFYDVNSETGKQSISVSLAGAYLYINEECFDILDDLIIDLLEMDFFKEATTYKYLQDVIIDWLILFNKEKRVGISLEDFMLNKIYNDTEEHIYYFLIDSLAIEHSFDLMTVNIVHVSEEFIEKKYALSNSKKPVERENFEFVFDGCKGLIVAEVKVRGVEDKAVELAKFEATLAVGVFKLFFSVESVSEQYQMFDLSFRSKRLNHYTYVRETINESHDFSSSFESRTGVSHVFVNDNTLKTINEENIFSFLEFIANKDSKDELRKLILDSIISLSDAYSIRDYHERVVSIISFFERILLLHNYSKGDALTFLKNNVIDKILEEEDKSLARRLIISFYSVRNKYLHNKVLLPIDLPDLVVFQYFAVKFLRRLIYINKTMYTIAEMHSYFGIRHVK